MLTFFDAINRDIIVIANVNFFDFIEDFFLQNFGENILIALIFGGVGLTESRHALSHDSRKAATLCPC